jgi:hypothetical protein
VRKIDLQLVYQSTLTLNFDYQSVEMNFEIDLRGIQSMFDQGLYNKIKADIMDNNFDVVALAFCHIKIQEKRPK